MRILFFLSMLFFFNSNLFSQSVDWLADNPKWSVYMTAGFAGTGTEIVTVNRDTTLGGRAAKVLYRQNFVQDGISILSQSDDSIFLWNHANAQYYVLYNMKATVGTSFTQPLRDGGAFLTYEVIEKGTMTIGNESLRFQKWSTNNSNCTYLVIEKIGMVKFECTNPQMHSGAVHFFWNEPDNSAVDGPSRHLCEYRNDNLSYEPFPGALYCNGIVKTSSLLDATKLTVVPNPAVSETLFFIESDVSSEYTLDLYNYFGQRVMRSITLKEKYTLERGDLAEGVYVFSLKNKNGIVVQTGKLVFVD